MKILFFVLSITLAMVADPGRSAMVYKSKKRNLKTWLHKEPRYPAYFWISLIQVPDALPLQYPVRPDVGWIRILNNPGHPLRADYSEIIAAKKYLGSLQGSAITSLLKPGRKYSYVILDGFFVLATIQPRPGHRYSKHIVASGFSPAVRYAGEAWTHPSDRHTLVLDNNSGTYKPDKAGLEELRFLLQSQLDISVAVQAYH